MSHQKKSGGLNAASRYLLIFSTALFFMCFSAHAFSQSDSGSRREHPKPPPRPKHPSLKEMVDKINIFKKHKKDDTQTDADKTGPSDDNHKQPDPKPQPPPNPPAPQPQPVKPKPKATVKHSSSKKKTTKPSTDKKKTDKPTQVIM